MKKEYNYRVYPMFCPDISGTPNMDYSKVEELAVKSYPGASNPNEALIFSSKHKQMSIDKAMTEISNYFNELDKKNYSDQWVSVILEYNLKDN